MPFIDKSNIKKGLKMFSDQPAPGWVSKGQAEQLRREFPEFEAAPLARLAELAEERRQLAARLDDIGKRIATYRKPS